MKVIDEAVQTGQLRYQPDTNLAGQDLIDQQKTAFLVGAVAFGLPTAVILAGLFLKTCFYVSISHYYYAQFWGSVFIGCLVFIGTYLLAWQGQSRGERLLANFAAPFAWGVALFPTNGAGCAQSGWEGRVFADIVRTQDGQISLTIPDNPDSYFNLLSWTGTLHALSAGILFLVLAYFALVVFTRIIPERDLNSDGTLTPEKAKRNSIYRICGWVIVAMILCLGGKIFYGQISGSEIPFWDEFRLTLICEAIALYAFGLSWMVKGRFWGKALVDTRQAV